VKNLVNIAKMVALYGQLGFTIVTPPVVMALLCAWVQQRFLVGSWIMVLGILLGLTASASGAYGFYRRVIAAEKKDKNNTSIVFYHHE